MSRSGGNNTAMTKGQRTPRDATIATTMLPPGSLQRMVRKHEGRHGAHTRSTLSAHMNNHNTVSTGVASATQTQVPTTLKPLLKVALDVHLALYVAAFQEEGSHPKPPQRFKPADFLKWIDKQLARGFRIVTCYEAGPLGFVLHRQLTARG